MRKAKSCLNFFEKFLDEHEIDANSLALKITFSYTLILTLWILFYNSIMTSSFYNTSLTLTISIVKSLIFVLISSAINFKLLKIIFTRLIASKNEIQLSNVLLSAVLESSEEIMFFSLDTNYRYTAFNNIYKEAISNLYHKTIEKNMNILDVIEYDENQQNLKENFNRILNGENFTTVEEYTTNKCSSLYWQVYYSPLISNNGKTIGLTSFALNITTLKKAENQNIFLSYHDELTGLYNRRFFEEKLKEIDTENNYPISIIISDVNGLKFTNDIFGHTAGDKLIKTFAEILQKFCRQDDIVARIGGDEFYILLPKTDSMQAKQIIDRIKNSILDLHVEKSILSVSFGFSTKYTSNESLEKTSNKADDTMYSQKLLDRDIFESKLIKHLDSILYDKNLVKHFHGQEVSLLCKKIGMALGLTQDEIQKLELAGLLHDIGKVAIDYKILLKHDGLTASELSEIKRHSEIGYKVLNYLNKYKGISEYVLYHHERIDGAGYPKGLKGDKIPLFSRIIHIADAYHSMTTNSTYRNALDIDAAIRELKVNAGSQFDAHISKIFVTKVLGENW
ncbi:diguanylate cyclase and metal dependent phosphohydrolase [Clostridium sp. DL-VIII]|uniref:sensor domain-containing diguanylate cyclase/phosphohydrolase n=1 Tax=Clostridium sp. DL-VIII TaxID=641107 RepID=UPI00023AF649|nr:HD domain-containing phosphohydrolase [Clostridium sp. DL-VIII]EHI96762.1 diguanylate cyclase and metal dependent phosphohydrolase [Clostridium sp. DL-VIII]